MKVLDILEVLANLTGKGAEEIKSILTKNANDDVLDETTVKAGLKELFGGKFQEISSSQHARGMREKGIEIERYIKNKGVKTDAIGTAAVDALFDHAVSTVESKTPDQPEVLTKESALKNPIVIDLLNDRTTTVKGQFETQINELQGKLSEGEKRKEKESILRDGLDSLKRLKSTVFDANGNIGNQQRRAIELLLSTVKSKVNAEGVRIPVDENGNQIQDKNFNPISWDDQVRALSPFGFHNQDPEKKSASPSTAAPGAASTGKSEKFQFENADSYRSYILNSSNSKEDKLAAKEAWDASKKTE